jgi:hypothetical protein
MKVAIYTSIFGRHATPAPTIAIPGVDWICFNDASVPCPGWERRGFKSPTRFAHPRMVAKWVKMNPKLLLPEYDVTLWLDGSFTVVRPDIIERLLPCLNPGGFAAFKHPDRNNIYDEATASFHMAKYAGEPIIEQCTHYRKQGLPENHGLWAGGALLRDNRSARIERMNLDWMNETILWSWQDQISLPYVLWKNTVQAKAFPYGLWDNPLLVHNWSGPDR